MFQLNSKSIFYIRNSQVNKDIIKNSLLKTSQSESDKNKIEQAPEEAINTQQPSTAEQKSPAQLSLEQDPTRILYLTNENRKSLGLRPYSSVVEMEQQKRELQRDYDAYLRQWISNGRTEEEFKKIYPSLDYFEKDLGSNRILPQYDFSDEEIWNFIIENKVDELSKPEISREVLRVLNERAKRLFSSIKKGESLKRYEFRLRTEISMFGFKHPKVPQYIYKVKMMEAESALERYDPEFRQRQSDAETAEQMARSTGSEKILNTPKIVRQ